MSSSSGGTGISLVSLLQASHVTTSNHHVTGSEQVTGRATEVQMVAENDVDMAEAHENEAEMSMEDLMDVVTSYKCKFCQFTSPAPEGISSHVKSEHMDLIQATRKKKPVEQTQQLQTHEVKVTKSGQTHQNNTKVENVVITADSISGFQQVLQVGEGTQLIVQDDSGEHITLQVAEEPEGSNIVEQAFHVSTTIEEEDGGTAMLVSAADVKNNMDDVEEGTMTTDDGCDVTTQTENKVMKAEVAVETQTQTLHGVDAAEEADESHMYVCGQCNLGFTNIEECKQHMVKDHNITMEAMECLDEQVEKEIHGGEPTKVSVAIQVVPAKRPGRKPKRATEPVVVVESDEEIEDDEDEDESENIQVRRNDPDFSDSEYGKGKRRIRPPKAMTDIYYMGKKKPPMTKKRRPEKLEGYDLKCSVPGCSAKFKTADVLLLHEHCHIDTKDQKLLENKTKDGQDGVFACPRCEQRFKLWKQLRMHLWKDHQVDTDLLSCDKCDFRSESILKIEMHQEIHSADRSHVCPICQKGFKQASQLRNHRLNVHRKDDGKLADPLVHSCHICKREFATSKYLHNHLQQVHATVKPFQCAYCNHTTARKAMMELHIRTHTGEKPYKCDLCNYASGDHNSLRRHKMRHSGRKPYKCQHCPYSCIQAISLKTHMKNKHPGCSDGIYMCDQCQYRTVNKQNYDNHVEDHRNGLVFQGQDGEEDPGSAGGAGGSSAAGKRRPAVAGKQAKPPKPLQAYVVPGTVDLSKVASMEGLAPVSAAQLIYSALNAMSQQQQQPQQQHQQRGSDTTSQAVSEASLQQASSVTSTTHDGITTHTITLHLPQLTGGATPAELPPGSSSQEGTSSGATVDVANATSPVVLAVNHGNQQAISLLGGATTTTTAEPSAAAGGVQLVTTDGSQGQQQVVTDIVQQAIQGLEVLHQGGDSSTGTGGGQTHILQAVPPQQQQQQHTQIVHGLDALQSSQILQALNGLQSFEGIQVLQPHQLSTIAVDGQTLQIQGQNIIATDTGQILFKSETSEGESQQQNSAEQS